MVSDTVHQALVCHVGKIRLGFHPRDLPFQISYSSLHLCHYGVLYAAEVGQPRLVRPTCICDALLHSFAVDAPGASWYVPTRFQCFISLTVRVKVEVIFNVSYPMGPTRFESP